MSGLTALFERKNAKKLYIDAGKDLKIHKISKSVTYNYLLKNIDLEMLPHLKINVDYFLQSIHLAAALHGDIEATDGPKKLLEIKFMITWRSIKFSCY